MQEKYINPFMDFGFKKIFGKESNVTAKNGAIIFTFSI